MSRRRNAKDGESPTVMWWVKDWLTSESVLSMSRSARSLYFDMLMHQWLDGSLPANHTVLARIAGEGLAEFKALWVEVTSMFPVCPDGRLRNERMEIERKADEDYRAERSEAGAAGNAKRWSDHRSAIAQRSNSDSLTDRKSVATPIANVSPPLSPDPLSSSSSSSSTQPLGEVHRAPRGRPRKSSPTSPTPGHAEFVGWWTKAFLAQTGAPYAFAAGKDGEHVRRCLVALKGDLVELQRRATILLQCAPEWIASGGVDLGILENQLNRLASAGQVEVASGAKHNAIREATKGPIETGLFDHRKPKQLKP